MKTKIYRVLFPLSVFIFALTAAISFAIFFRPFYYGHIQAFNLTEAVNLSAGQIRANYDAMMNYLTWPWVNDFILPDLPASQSGVFHFFEVKRLFAINFILLFVTLFSTPYLYGYLVKRVSNFILLADLRKLIWIPIIIVALMVIDFNQFFVLFHKILFNNDAWLFHPATDPVILILPEAFFRNAFILVIILTVIVILAVYLFIKNQKNRASHQS